MTSVGSPYGPAGQGLHANTVYGYGSAAGNQYYTGGIPSNLLTSVTAPNGWQTQIGYGMNPVNIWPYGVQNWAPTATSVTTTRPGAMATVLSLNYTASQYPIVGFTETVASTGELINNGELNVTSANGTFTVMMSPQNTAPSPSPPPVQMFVWEKVYDVFSENLLQEVDDDMRSPSYGDTTEQNLGSTRSPVLPTWVIEQVSTNTTYNFMGKPLEQDVVESYLANPQGGGGVTSGPTKSTYYAYWDQTKYFQQKAVVDPSGRVSYTDYFTNTAAPGSLGQTSAVYDAQHGNWPTPLPSGWQSNLVPGSGATAAATFTYDAQGRPTVVKKYNPTGNYVTTATTYGADGTPTWGQAATVTEDLGGINRTTTTNAYTSWGKASQVTDAAGHQFQTNYNLDGQVQSVMRLDVPQTLVSYTYGQTQGAVEFNQPLTVTDGLTGVVQNISYVQPGQSPTAGGVGQPSQVAQSGGLGASYTVGYTYDDQGDRASTTYVTPDGTTTWQYSDYLRVGDPMKPSRAFQTLTKVVNGTLSAEELDYVYDNSGRLLNAFFAQSPQTRTGAPTTAPFYTSGYPAQSRAIAIYSYDPAGRVLSLEHDWQTLNSDNATFSSNQILTNNCAYDPIKGLKTSSQIVAAMGAHTETYTYDPNFDYLNGASYNDGQPNPSPAWTYDYAGNRSGTTYVGSISGS